MKKLIILTILITTVITNVFSRNVYLSIPSTAPLNGSTILFPDAAFKTYLVSNSAINTNGDNDISIQEAYNFTGKINISGNTAINSILGIEYFYNLKVFDCSSTNIDSLSYRLMSNINLDSLVCKNNTLSSVFYLSNCKPLYINMRGMPSGGSVQLSPSNLTSIIEADSIIQTTPANPPFTTTPTSTKVAGVTVSHSSIIYYSHPNGAYDIIPTYKLVNINVPFICDNIIGLANLVVTYDSIVWNTGEKTPMLFNQCSGIHTAKLYSKSVNQQIPLSTPNGYLLLDFSSVDTTIIANNPNTYSATPVDTTTINTTHCPAIPDSMPKIIGYYDYSYIDPTDTLNIVLLWSYSRTALVDTFTTKAPRTQGLNAYVANLFCPDGTYRSIQAGKVIVTDYMNITNDTGIVWKYGILTTATSIETYSSNTEITVAPNPFSTTTKISGLTTGKLKLVTISGSEVYSQVIQENIVEINREGLSSGIYFLQVTLNTGVTVTKKIIIE